MNNIALTMVAGSVYQMMRGMKIAVTAFFSIVFLKRKLYRHHWSSVAVIFIGLVLVGVAVLTGGSTNGIASEPLGIILLLLGTVFTSGMFIVEEKVLGSYYLDPLKVVGYEGLFGFLMWCVLLPIFQQIDCQNDKLCPYGRLEDTSRAFQDYGANYVLILLSLAICFTIAMFNAFGVAVTKNASSAQRATIDTSRTLFIWIFFLIVSVNGKREDFYWLQLFGFILLVIGTLVFNEIVIVPFLGFDRYTKRALALEDSAHPPVVSGVSPLIASCVSRNEKLRDSQMKS
jgi:drug/metabolite transporter (DMT)-like permease